MLVNVDSGTLKGETLTNVLTGEPYLSFKGVPYAHPPVGALRFKPPQPIEKFKDVLECCEERGICPQKELPTFEHMIGTEDCLYLNVFTPQLPAEGVHPKPVMVFIHGGGLVIGSKSASEFGPDFLVSKGVVLVTLNYRLNIFGFLNLGIEECKGNMGLLDQRAALMWVQGNIAEFGGDPNNITLFGESAGSVSVHFHILSPLSKGLFHKAILQSGSSIDSWAFMSYKEGLETAFCIGKKLGFETTDVKKLFNFLQYASTEDLTEAVFARQLELFKTSNKMVFSFVVSKENAGLYDNRFLPESPDILLSNAPEVPILSGVDAKEGLVMQYIAPPESIEIMVNKGGSLVDENIPRDIELAFKNNPNFQSIKDKIKDFYFGSSSDCKASKWDKCFDFLGDVNFVRGHFKTLKTYASLSSAKPIYSYLFSYEGSLNLLKLKQLEHDKIKGACHGDELCYLFYREEIKEMLSKLPLESEKNMIDNVTTLWTNFAKFGNPNGDLKLNWQPVTLDDPSYCVIDTNITIQKGYIFQDRMKIWDEIDSQI